MDSPERHFQKTLSLMQEGKSEEALKELENAEEAAKILLKDPENEFFQTNLQINFTDVLTLGNLLYKKGRFPQAQNFYELSFLISQKLLKTDPENVGYQSNVAMTLNNLGNLLSDMGRIKEAKRRYEKSLGIYTEPLQYLTIGRKSESIIKLIGLNSELAEKDNDPFNQMKYLRETFKLCKEYREFFLKYELKHERELVT